MNDPTNDLANNLVDHIFGVLDQTGDSRMAESLQTNYDSLRSIMYETALLYLKTVSSERASKIDVGRMTDLVMEKLKTRFLHENTAA